MDVVFIALGVFFVDPLAAVVYVLLESMAAIDPDYRGYVVVAFVVFSLLRRRFLSGKD